MSSRRCNGALIRRARICTLALGLTAGALLLTSWSRSGAQERRFVGKCLTPAGSLLQRTQEGKPWRTVQAKEDVSSGDLLVSLTNATIESKSGSVRLALKADPALQSPLPVAESAVVLHDNAQADLDFTLERGRVEIVNLKKKGAVQVRVRFRNEAWDLTLNDPDAKVMLEYYGRWPAGSAFTTKPTAEDVPGAELALLVISGQVDLKAGSQQHALSAPPGPALFQWTSAAGADQGPRRLLRIPDWADPKPAATEQAKAMQAALDRLQKRLATKQPTLALAEHLASADATDRRMAVSGLGALDELSGLIDALSDGKRADVRAHAVVALRHWIGREAGQDLKMYGLLVEKKGYSKAHGEIVVQLLHSFGENDLGRPETYESLIAYLKHPKLPIRELARWHLYRLVYAGKDISYDPAGSTAAIEAGYKEWKKLIPDGMLPKK